MAAVFSIPLKGKTALPPGFCCSLKLVQQILNTEKREAIRWGWGISGFNCKNNTAFFFLPPPLPYLVTTFLVSLNLSKTM
jgi:hypothetical protein